MEKQCKIGHSDMMECKAKISMENIDKGIIQLNEIKLAKQATLE
jgi:hypothetical protein